MLHDGDKQVKPIPRIVIAGTHTGCGKTTLALGLMRALARRGLRVQAFKAGPDFIDPSYHSVVTGRPSRNLDTWMMPRDALMECFDRAARDADIAVIEGMMGLYDGRDAVGDDGSTAQLAKQLDAPVVLVVDCSPLARSAAAMVLGYRRFDPGVQILGVVLNNVGGAKHWAWMRDAITPRTGVPVLGGLVGDASFALPERHLGLVPQIEHRPALEQFDRIADALEQLTDLDQLLALARAAPPLRPFARGTFPAAPPADNLPVIAVARDEAFSFYYEDNLDLLRQRGARLVDFSPLHDRRVPDAGLIYIGGGFPEVFAEKLAENAPMRASVKEFAASGKPIYAECGGLMYLADSIATLDGAVHPMVGLFGTRVRMHERLAALGYLEVTAVRDTWLMRRGETARGHEFHYSTLEATGETPSLYEARGFGGATKSEGFAWGSVIASYVHLHFASNLLVAQRLVTAAAAGVPQKPLPRQI